MIAKLIYREDTMTVATLERDARTKPFLKHPERLYIGGAWVQPSSSTRIEIISPSSEERVTAVAEAQTADVDRAVAAARKAFDRGPWSRSSLEERVAKVRALADKVGERAEDLARAWTLQVGTPYRMAQGSSGYYPGLIRTFCDIAEKNGFVEQRPAAVGGVAMVIREPIGVVAAIVPWNAPMPTLLVKVIPALLAGCTVIAKPSPETPLEALILAECADEVGFPEGVLSVLPANREVSDYLVHRPEIDKVSFTGSTAVGLHIASVCGGRMARVVTELGGKSAAIVLDDANMEKVVQGIIPTLVLMSGQQCAAFSRILVSPKRHDELVHALGAAMSALKVGDPFEQDTFLGPLVARRQRDRVCGLMDRARSEGAKAVIGGGRPANLSKGWFVEPTLFTNVKNDMEIARQEIFGPVGIVIPFASEEEAIDIANDSNYGLSGGVFTEDTDRAYAVGRRIRTGNFAQNGRVIDFSQPYGGFKQSGIGREGGLEGLYSFTEIKTMFLPRAPTGFAAPVA